MVTRWLLDITESRDGRAVVLWTKEGTHGRVERTPVDYRPPFWVAGRQADLAALQRTLRGMPGVDTVLWQNARSSLEDARRHRLLAVTPTRNHARRKIATAIDALGGYRRFTLLDVDLGPPQLYYLQHDLYPFAPVEGSGGDLRATEKLEEIVYAVPPLTTASLAIEIEGTRPGRIAPLQGRIAAIRIGETRLEGDEEELLRALVRELSDSDPDLLLTDGGDGFDLPRLYERARAHALTDGEFYLGREPAAFRPTRAARSFESYGRVEYRDATFPLPGRFHIDRENSFLFDDAKIDGLIDAARLARLSLQTVARQSPGTCFTAMEMAYALSDGVHIPWKKSRPEEFKSARTLVEADRGGVMFLPPVGIHDRVDEFDFASLYPHIMVQHNLSIETLDCRCCPKSSIVAPGLGYRSCVRRKGLIPQTLEPLLVRRSAYKTMAKDPRIPEAERQRFKHRVKMLKWILVTAFGYQGYRNARFGRIECHEAINAYARELLTHFVADAEAAGYRVLHGIVDSLWLTPASERSPPDPEEFAATIRDRRGLPLGYEGRYRWIVFLPSANGLGVPNRYYGRYANGEFKLRGIGGRRRDTTGIVRKFEHEVLELFGGAGNAAELRALLPKALARADLFATALRNGRWPVEELLITHRVGKPLPEFVTFTDSVAALRQLAAVGVTRHPGEQVRYVLVDRASRSWRDRVRVAERLDGSTGYDAEGYLEILARAAETLLAPLGVRRESLRARWGIVPPPERSPYRSLEATGQVQLPGAANAPGMF